MRLASGSDQMLDGGGVESTSVGLTGKRVSGSQYFCNDLFFYHHRFKIPPPHVVIWAMVNNFCICRHE